MRVLLVYPNAKKEIIGWGDLGAIAEPIALEYLAAGARLDGHDVKLLDLRLHNEELDETLREFQPEVVGVTGYSMHVLRSLDICRRAKELVPGCVTVVGGTTPRSSRSTSSSRRWTSSWSARESVRSGRSFH